MGFHVSIIARIKHGDLREAIRKRGWTQKQAAEFLGMRPDSFWTMINLRWIPKKISLELERKLLELTGKSPKELWPDAIRRGAFLSRPKIHEVTREIPEHLLESVASEQLLLPSAEECYAADEIRGVLFETLAKLAPRERLVLERRYFDSKTLKEIGAEVGVGVERARQLIIEALRRIRYSPVGAQLRLAVRGHKGPVE